MNLHIKHYSSSDQLAGFKEHFNSVPRAVLECSVRDQLLPESDIHNVRLSLDQRERLCCAQQQLESGQQALLLAERQLIDLRNSVVGSLLALYVLLLMHFASR